MISNILGSLILLIKTKGDISGLKKTDKALLNVTKNANLLKKVTGGIFGAMNIHSIRDGFTKYLQLEKDIGAMKSRFFAVTKDEKLAVEEFEYIRKLATETAMDIKSTADSYSIFASATFKNLGKEGARGVFEDWTRVGRVLHLSEYQFERVTYALREMASKGAIYSQDLRMQIGTHVPNAMGLAQKAAEELGITGTDWFEKLQKKAKGNTELTSKFVKLFSKQAREAYGSEEAFRKAMQQPDALAANIKNLGTNFMIDFSNAGGSQMMVNILQKTYEALETIDLKGMANALGSIAKGLGQLANLLPSLIILLRHLVITFIGFKVFQHISRGIVWIATLLSYKKNATFAKALGKMFGRNVFARLFRRYGLKNILREGFLKALTGLGFKQLTKIGLSLVPGVGQAIAIGWTIVDAIWLIRDLLIKNKDSNKKLIGDITKGQVVDMLNTVAKNPNALKSTEDLHKSLNRLDGGKEIAGYTYIDNGRVMITINGADMTADELAKRTIKELEKYKDNKYNNKPKKKEIMSNENTSSIRGY